jgi:hypothetical protein
MKLGETPPTEGLVAVVWHALFASSDFVAESVSRHPFRAINIAIICAPGTYIGIPTRAENLATNIDATLNHLGCSALNWLLIVVRLLAVTPVLLRISLVALCPVLLRIILVALGTGLIQLGCTANE